MATVLVTGIAGSLARLTAEALVARGWDVVGVDYRPAPTDLPDNITFARASYNKTRIEDIVRHHKPEGILHLGRVGNLKVRMNKRFDLNVIGSAKLMEVALKHHMRRMVVLSTFHIYGAHPHNHIPIHEDEPLRAGTRFPQLADALQLDSQAVTWTYRHRSLRTAVLRPCNVVGPHIQNAISRYLRQRRVGYVLGFNPMWQFVHELVVVEALIRAWEGDAVGVFNVAGTGAMPVVDAMGLTGATRIPLPDPAVAFFLRMQRHFVPAFPPYLLDFFKYPCVIGDARFRQELGYEPTVGLAESIRSTVSGA